MTVTPLHPLLPHGIVSDEELSAEAIAADPEPSLEGARPFAEVIGDATAGELPSWYMPAPMLGPASWAGAGVWCSASSPPCS